MPAIIEPPFFSRRHDIYFNLTRRVWSLRGAHDGPGVRRGIVTGHALGVLAFGCRPRVSAAGRARVIRERVKNVHAFIGCDTLRVVSGVPFHVSAHTPQVTYNPYREGVFVDAADRGPLPAELLPVCYFSESGRVYYSDRIIRAGENHFLDPWTFDAWAESTAYDGPADTSFLTFPWESGPVSQRVERSGAVA